MARVLRIQAPGVVQHVITRFVDRSWQLVGDDERAAYLERLAYALARTDWHLLGYALMSSHAHLVVEAGLDSLESWTKSVHSRMARWLNRRHGGLGSVFADRPYAELLEASRVPHVVAYVHNNPVRARVVAWAGDTNWSSHRAYLGLEPPVAGLSVQRSLALCGYSDDAAGRNSFDDWVRSCSGQPRAPRPEDGVQRALSDARNAAGAPVSIATPLRNERGLTFPLLATASSVIGPAMREVSSSAVLAAVRAMVGTDPRGRYARDHRPEVALARRVSLLAWARAGRPRVEMARALGIGASSASDLVRLAPQAKRVHVLVDRVWEMMQASKGGSDGLSEFP